VPRPSSPLGAKASTERPCLTHHPTTNTPARSTKPRNKPKANKQQAITLTNLHFHSQIHLSKITRQGQVLRPGATCGGFGSTHPSRPEGRGTHSPGRQPSHCAAVPRRSRQQVVGLQTGQPGGFFLQRSCRKNGGKRIRTDDPLLAKQVLYQLSYAPVVPIRRSRRTDAAAHPAGAPHGAATGGLQHPTGDFSGTWGARKNGPGRT
jgi:hypothetical protein